MYSSSLCSFENNPPAFYHFRAYLTGLGKARATKCGTV